MSMEIILPTAQIESLIRSFAGADEFFDREARITMTNSLAILERITKTTAPADTGLLRNSIASKIIGRALDMIGYVFSPLLYAIIMESGREPGTWPNIDAVTRWVERKRLATSPEMIGKLGFVISRSIKNKGIEGRRFFENAFESSQVFIVKQFEWMCNKFVESF